MLVYFLYILNQTGDSEGFCEGLGDQKIRDQATTRQKDKFLSGPAALERGSTCPLRSPRSVRA